jgi:shikimate kinase
LGAPAEGRKHLFLVGLPGAGKSTVGALLAQALRCDFVDFDEVIQREAEMPISDIFARYGQEHFRELELQLTRRVCDGAPCVAAPGGGWITQEDSVAALGDRGAIIWLQVSPAVAVRRMGAGSLLRPLLAGSDPEDRLAALARVRDGLYARAGARINTELLSSQEVASSILPLASSWGWSLG